MITEQNYLSFQKHINQSTLYRFFWVFFGNYAFVIFIIAGVWVCLYPTYHENWQALIGLSILSFVISRVFVVFLINQFYKRVRPYQQFGFKPIETKFFSFIDAVHDSFPSRHTTAYFSIAVVVFLLHPMLGAILIITSAMAGIARVIMGWHWPTDIVAGLVIGSLIAYLSVHFALPFFFTLS